MDGDRSGAGSSAGGGAGQSVTVGAFDFGESIVLAEIYRQKLASEGFAETMQTLSTGEVVEPALGGR